MASTSTIPALPVADALYDRALGHLPGGNSRTTLFVAPHPPYATSGRGHVLRDADGREVIDLQNNYTSLIHGHAHPEVTEAAARALHAGASFGLPTEHEIELAELLSQRVAIADRWRFANSGTEAVMVAIRLARAVTGRDAILRFEGCYHGSADAVVQHGARGVPQGVKDDVVTVPVGDEAALVAALDAHGDRLACVVFDAMPNRAGLRPADPAFVTLLRTETARRGILLLWDEVLTFRAGLGGLQGQYGVEPDITTLGKIIGGGLPVGAIGGRAEIMDAFDPRRDDAVGHGGTFSANPVTLAAGTTAMRLLDATAIDRLNALGDALRERLAAQGWTVTGQGSLLRVHVPDATALWWRLWAKGVLISVNGLLCLSTPMDEDTTAAVADAFESLDQE
ncbi:MAG TPA: aminotransferase class III-fold pyridoxal phosphate-dependent enzyme [Baekduia sp.]|uniref:aspartate aminotransferase family protein n=1 Tax=Baekduia sp. TaxID=2600305 RepID=UPI002D7A1875|nr:aminotransferase class III-fold pyridoxal phosphate-dependent enzyme [Baekduia sp.]HET6509704.1 aminotransferase class III-fold pyridoxal phosphate-dependent enzyme [Baekduia sp.]